MRVGPSQKKRGAFSLERSWVFSSYPTLCLWVPPVGIEPTTFGLWDQRDYQLRHSGWPSPRAVYLGLAKSLNEVVQRRGGGTTFQPLKSMLLCRPLGVRHPAANRYKLCKQCSKHQCTLTCEHVSVKPKKITGKISFGIIAGCKQTCVQLLALLCELFFLDLAFSVSLEALRHWGIVATDARI